MVPLAVPDEELQPRGGIGLIVGLSPVAVRVKGPASPDRLSDANAAEHVIKLPGFFRDDPATAALAQVLCAREYLGADLLVHAVNQGGVFPGGNNSLRTSEVMLIICRSASSRSCWISAGRNESVSAALVSSAVGSPLGFGFGLDIHHCLARGTRVRQEVMALPDKHPIWDQVYQYDSDHDSGAASVVVDAIEAAQKIATACELPRLDATLPIARMLLEEHRLGDLKPSDRQALRLSRGPLMRRAFRRRLKAAARRVGHWIWSAGDFVAATAEHVSQTVADRLWGLFDVDVDE
jgi:hypothetical protein